MSAWKGLASELRQVTDETPVVDDRSTPTVETSPPRTSEPAASVETITQDRPVRRRNRGASFLESHRLVGIYFPHDVDQAFRDAAAAEGISNSAFVVAAVRHYLETK